MLLFTKRLSRLMHDCRVLSLRANQLTCFGCQYSLAVPLVKWSVLCCRYADQDQLQAIYSAYLQPVLSSSLKSHPVWGAAKNVHTLAGSMVAVYEQVSDHPLTFTLFTLPFTYKSSVAKKQLQFSKIIFGRLDDDHCYRKLQLDSFYLNGLEDFVHSLKNESPIKLGLWLWLYLKIA